VVTLPAHPAPRNRKQVPFVPLLENGLRLTASEFLDRYEAMPEVKKAELIDGIVYMASPVRADQHGDPDALVQTCLGLYRLSTPGLGHVLNSTLRLGADDVPQPDGLLYILPEWGGRARLDRKGYLIGPVELVVEIAASSASIDARDKLDSYRRAGVQEYLLWRTEDEAVDWWFLREDEYVPLPEEAGGVLRSQALPGLWLHRESLLARDAASLARTVHAGLASPEHAAFVERLQRLRGSKQNT